MLFEACYLIEPAPEMGSSSRMAWSFPQDLSGLRKKSPGLCDVKVLDQFCYFDHDEFRGHRYKNGPVVGSHSLAQTNNAFAEDRSVVNHERKTLSGLSEVSYFNIDREYYGIALRCVTPPDHNASKRSPFRSMKYNLLKRPRGCYVIISKYASPDLYPRTFERLRNSLYCLHGLDLARSSTSNSNASGDHIKQYLQQLLATSVAPSPPQATITATANANASTSVHHSNNNMCAPLLPLLEVLGASKFVTLLAALLTERRVLVVSEDTETLCRAVSACRSMLSLVSSSIHEPSMSSMPNMDNTGSEGAAAGSAVVMDWHHIFIPSLPCGLLTMLDAPMPYLIGIKRYLLQKIDDGDEAFEEPTDGSKGSKSGSIYGNNMDGVVFLDVDSGILEVLGQSSSSPLSSSSRGNLDTSSGSGPIVDLVGDSSSALSLASEKAAQLKSFMNQGDDSGPVRKDIVRTVLQDLRAVLAAKPVQVTSGAAGSLLNSAKSALVVGYGSTSSSSPVKTVFGGKFLTKVGVGTKEEGTADSSGLGAKGTVDWQSRGEKAARDSLLLFYLYLFADLQDFILPNKVRLWAHAEEEQQQKKALSSSSSPSHSPSHSSSQLKGKGAAEQVGAHVDGGGRPRRPSGGMDIIANNDSANNASKRKSMSGMSAREKLFLMQNNGCIAAADPKVSKSPSNASTGSSSSSSSSSGSGIYNKGDSSSLEGAFQDGDVRGCFNLEAFVQKKRSKEVKVPPAVLVFLHQFLHTQAFEQFCLSKVLQLVASYKMYELPPSPAESVFDRVRNHISLHGHGGGGHVDAGGPKGLITLLSISAVKQSITAVTESSNNNNNNNANTAEEDAARGLWEYTERGDHGEEEDQSSSSSSSSISPSRHNAHAISELSQLHALASSVATGPSIGGAISGLMSAMYARLTDCLSVGAKGVIGRKGWAALKALHFLLLFLDNSISTPASAVPVGLSQHSQHSKESKEALHSLYAHCCGHLVPLLLRLLDVRATQHSYLGENLSSHVFGRHGHRAVDLYLDLFQDSQEMHKAPVSVSAEEDDINTATSTSPTAKDKKDKDRDKDKDTGTSEGRGRGTRLRASAAGTSDRVKMQAMSVLLLLFDSKLLHVRRAKVRGLLSDISSAATQGTKRMFLEAEAKKRLEAYVRLTMFSCAKLDASVMDSSRYMALGTNKPDPLLTAHFTVSGIGASGILPLPSNTGSNTGAGSSGGGVGVNQGGQNMQNNYGNSTAAEADLLGVGLSGFESDSPQVRAIRAEMKFIYQVHYPDKVKDVDTLLLKYSGKEAEMLAKLKLHYNLPTSAPVSSSSSGADGMGGSANNAVKEKKVAGSPPVKPVKPPVVLQDQFASPVPTATAAPTVDTNPFSGDTYSFQAQGKVQTQTQTQTQVDPFSSSFTNACNSNPFEEASASSTSASHNPFDGFGADGEDAFTPSNSSNSSNSGNSNSSNNDNSSKPSGSVQGLAPPSGVKPASASGGLLDLLDDDTTPVSTSTATSITNSNDGFGDMFTPTKPGQTQTQTKKNDSNSLVGKTAGNGDKRGNGGGLLDIPFDSISLSGSTGLNNPQPHGSSGTGLSALNMNMGQLEASMGRQQPRANPMAMGAHSAPMRQSGMSGPGMGGMNTGTGMSNMNNMSNMNMNSLDNLGLNSNKTSGTMSGSTAWNSDPSKIQSYQDQQKKKKDDAFASILDGFK